MLGYTILALVSAVLVFVYIFLSGVGWTVTRGSLGPFNIGMSRYDAATAVVQKNFRSIYFPGRERHEAPDTIAKLKATIGTADKDSGLADCSDEWIVVRDDLNDPVRKWRGKRVYYLKFDGERFTRIRIWRAFTDL